MIKTFNKCIRLRPENVFTLDVYQKSEEIFMKTHVSMDRLFDEKLRKEIGERELLESLLEGAKRRDIRIIVIHGFTGVGKSELCRYLEIMLKGSSSGSIEVIHIPKSHLVVLGGWLAPLNPDLLTSKSLEEFLKGFEERKDELENVIFHILEAIIVWYKLPFIKYEKLLREIATRAISRRLELLRKLREEGSSEELRRLVLSFFTHEELEKIGIKNPDAVNKLVSSFIFHLEATRQGKKIVLVNLGEWIRGKLRKAVEKGKYPVLIIDDATLLSDDVFKSLIDTISDVSQLPPSGIVVGLTTGIFREKIRTIHTLADRASHQIYIDTRFILENEDAFLDFVKRYIGAVKDRNTCNLCPYVKEIGSKPCEILNSNSRDANKLFPLSETFVKHYYNYLRQLLEKGYRERVTPRSIINDLRIMINSWVEEGYSPAHTLFKVCFANFVNKGVLIDPATQYEYDREKVFLKSVIRTIVMYGKETKEGYEIKKDVLNRIFKFNLYDLILHIKNIKEEKEKIILTKFVKKGEEEGKDKGRGEEESKPDIARIRQAIELWYQGQKQELEYVADIINGLKELIELRRIRVLPKNPIQLVRSSKEKNEYDPPRIIISPNKLSIDYPLVLFLSVDELARLAFAVKVQKNEKQKILNDILIEHPEITDIPIKFRELVLNYLNQHYPLKRLAKVIISILILIYAISNQNEIPSKNKLSKEKFGAIIDFIEKNNFPAKKLCQLLKDLFFYHGSFVSPILWEALNEIIDPIEIILQEKIPESLNKLEYMGTAFGKVIEQHQQGLRSIIINKILTNIGYLEKDVNKVDIDLLGHIIENYDAVLKKIEEARKYNLDGDLITCLVKLEGILVKSSKEELNALFNNFKNIRLKVLEGSYMDHFNLVMRISEIQPIVREILEISNTLHKTLDLLKKYQSTDVNKIMYEISLLKESIRKKLNEVMLNV